MYRVDDKGEKMKIKDKFINLIKRKFDLYDIEDLEVGGHCGLCGDWMPKEIVPKYFQWSLCDKCMTSSIIEELKNIETDKLGNIWEICKKILRMYGQMYYKIGNI